MSAKKKEVKIMDDNQKKFLNELAQLFEKYSINYAYVADKGFGFISHGKSLSFQNYKDGAFFNVRTYKPEYNTTEEE